MAENDNSGIVEHASPVSSAQAQRRIALPP